MRIWGRLKRSHRWAKIFARNIALLFFVVYVGSAGAAAQLSFFLWERCKDARTAPDVRIQDCTQVIDSGPKQAFFESRALVYRGEARIEKDEFVQAIQDFDVAIRLNDRNADAWGDRCFVRAVVGQFEQAMNDCNQSLILSKRPWMLDPRAFVYLKTGKLDMAISDYDAVLAKDPWLASSFYGRGVAERLKGEIQSSNADFAAAEKLDPSIAAKFTKWGVPDPRK